MTEEEARAWVRTRFGVSRETALDRFGTLVRDESQRQNLIAASTLDQIWSRHLTDSAQLVPLAEGAGEGVWLDIGSGAGFPGMVVALLCDRSVTLVEPRARRAQFLRESAEALGIAARVRIHLGKVESCRPDRPVAVISARAVAGLADLFTAALPCADISTLWVFPRGRNAQSEVEVARKPWQGVFHVKQSITSLESGIVIARKVRRR